MSVRLRLAELYRSLDRDAEAVEIENEIRGLMAYADSDFWLVRRLDGTPDPMMPVPSPVAAVDVDRL